jgi:hypothetical protein
MHHQSQGLNISLAGIGSMIFCAKSDFLRQVTSFIVPTRVGWFGPINRSTCAGNWIAPMRRPRRPDI